MTLKEVADILSEHEARISSLELWGKDAEIKRLKHECATRRTENEALRAKLEYALKYVSDTNARAKILYGEWN